MFGTINRAPEYPVKNNSGEQKWRAIKEHSRIKKDFFISNEAYGHAIAYKPAIAVSVEMNLSMEDVVIVFKEWRVVKTGKEKFGGLMDISGHSLSEFLVNITAFNNRAMLIFPKLTPPEFKVTDIEVTRINLHYFSKTEVKQKA